MELNEYLNTFFPGLILKPSLYHQWDIGLHFELGEGIYQFKEGTDELNLEMFKLVYSQSLSIFTELFSEEDKVFLVTNVYKHKTEHRNKRIKIYDRYIKNKDLKYQLKQETLPYVFDEEEDANDYYTTRYSLKCRKQDFNYQLLIKAACNEDFPLKPKFGGDYAHYPDVFFVNATKNITFFIYDDRGCEVIAGNQETIRPLYEKYGDWIDEDYKEEINDRFK